MFLTLLLIVLIAAVIATGFSTYFIVGQARAVIIERLGKYNRIATAGLNFKLPWVEKIATTVDLRVRQFDVSLETKTKDNVIVKLALSVQFFVKPEKIQDAFYKLADHENQINSWVMNEVRSHLPNMTLDEAFESNERIAKEVADKLKVIMQDYGYEIVAVLVKDLDPNESVKKAMNEINAAQRMQEAAKAKGEADKILLVKKAEGEAESKKLQGEGIANERKAIIAGLKESLKEFQESVEGSTAKEAMDLVLTVQYFDTLKAIGETGRTNTIFVPHGRSVNGIADDIRNSMLQAGAAGLCNKNTEQ